MKKQLTIISLLFIIACSKNAEEVKKEFKVSGNVILKGNTDLGLAGVPIRIARSTGNNIYEYLGQAESDNSGFYQISFQAKSNEGCFIEVEDFGDYRYYKVSDKVGNDLKTLTLPPNQNATDINLIYVGSAEAEVHFKDTSSRLDFDLGFSYMKSDPIGKKMAYFSPGGSTDLVYSFDVLGSVPDSLLLFFTVETPNSTTSYDSIIARKAIPINIARDTKQSIEVKF